MCGTSYYISYICFIILHVFTSLIKSCLLASIRTCSKYQESISVVPALSLGSYLMFAQLELLWFSFGLHIWYVYYQQNNHIIENYVVYELHIFYRISGCCIKLAFSLNKPVFDPEVTSGF